ncbi:MAG: apolipoprotein N-acyltransferase [Gemmatimonadota bacterium]|nr:MAG: apolipoprotein N-acyltransferase [Gemmatimonadota bacterium]
MKALALPKGDWLLIVASSALLTIAYPPFHLFLPSFICLIPAIWLLQDGLNDPRPLRRSLVQGFWFGLISNGFVIHWMVVALWRFTQLSVLGYLATITILAGYAAVLFALVGWMLRKAKISILISFPVLWTAMQWAIAHQGDIRFPWMGLGSSLTHYTTFVQIADVIGARGVTFLLVLANTALALAIRERGNRPRAVKLVSGVAVGMIVMVAYGVVRERTLETRALGRVSVIQPNVQWSEKNDSALQDSIMRATLELSRQAVEQTDPDLLVWPESAVPSYFHMYPRWEDAVRLHARENGIPLVTGGVHVVWGDSPDDYEYYNSAFLFDTAGAGKYGYRFEPGVVQEYPYPVYHKRYLVPIVERVPFLNPRWFNLRWFGGFGVGDPGPVFETDIGRFGILICYESIFEDLSRRYRREGTDFILNITNDAWYGETAAPHQHAAHLVMRAIENRIGIARAANSGISEFVDPLGREHNRTRLSTRAFASDMVMTTDVIPLYTRLGDWVGLLSVLLTLGLVGYTWRQGN